MSRFSNWTKPYITHGEFTIYGWKVFYPENFVMGERVDIGAGTHIFCQHGVEISDDVQIGGGCYIYSESTIDGKRGKIRIKKGACVGAMCVIMPGVTIGEGAIIGAMSFVNRDVPCDSITYGIPTRQRITP